MAQSVIIMGAAGRDFHNFNTLFRDDPAYRVTAFTAAQIPDIADRRYPPALSGPLYPKGIPILPEEELDRLLRAQPIDLVVFSYSDISHLEVMHRASLALARGAGFLLAGPRRTQLRARRPVIAVCAVRTGCGKSPTTRQVCAILRQRGRRPVVVRHPMPYGDLAAQAVQRFAAYADFDRHRCTIEEREEYEPLVEQGITVFAGIDYGQILRRAESEGDVIVWDGGNNDLPFFRPDIHIVLLDPHRAGHERLYFPGESNLLCADIALINKVDSAPPDKVAEVRATVAALRPEAQIVLARSEVRVSDPEAIRGKRVLAVEDGPTLTHGGMPFGAATLAARRFGAAEIVDPRPFARGSLAAVFAQHPHLERVLPAMGYGPRQVDELAATINAVPCDLVLFATPIDLPGLVAIDRPNQRVHYAYRDAGAPTLAQTLASRLERLPAAAGDAP